MPSGPPQALLVDRVKKHLLDLWPNAKLTKHKWSTGPVEDLGEDFCIIEVSPTRQSNNLWIYCTAGTADGVCAGRRYEFFLLTRFPEECHVETLTMLAHYHLFESHLDLGHIVAVGDNWTDGSLCDRLLISLPYPFGPNLEWLKNDGGAIRFLWALPITPAEAALAKQKGVEELERRFDDAKLRYWDPLRQSVV